MTSAEIEEIGLIEVKDGIFSDWEDIQFNIKTKELFYHSCVDGSLTLYRRVKDLQDLKQALYDGFANNRNELNLE